MPTMTDPATPNPLLTKLRDRIREHVAAKHAVLHRADSTINVSSWMEPTKLFTVELSCVPRDSRAGFVLFLMYPVPSSADELPAIERDVLHKLERLL